MTIVPLPTPEGQTEPVADKDGLFRLALLRTWNDRCSWCRGPLRFEDMQVDHLVPQKMEAATLRALIVDHDLPEDYDRDATRNLVPSHGSCNLGKSNKDLPRSARFGELLQLAAKRAPEVERLAERLGSEEELAKATAIVDAAQKRRAPGLEREEVVAAAELRSAADGDVPGSRSPDSVGKSILDRLVLPFGRSWPVDRSVERGIIWLIIRRPPGDPGTLKHCHVQPVDALGDRFKLTYQFHGIVGDEARAAWPHNFVGPDMLEIMPPVEYKATWHADYPTSIPWLGTEVARYTFRLDEPIPPS